MGGDRGAWGTVLLAGMGPCWEEEGRGAHGVGQRESPANLDLCHLGRRSKKRGEFHF